jgi:nitrite reductase (cytochrome c-552)
MTRQTQSRILLLTAFLGSAAAFVGITALLVNIQQRKHEAARPYLRVVEVTEDTTDPSVWGLNWPRQYDQYRRTAESAREWGHGGSESLPPQKAEKFPWLTPMFQGYAFAADYREIRGHAYMLHDQEQTLRLEVAQQSASCLHCHSSVMPLYRELGNGDEMAGFLKSYALTYEEGNQMLHDLGHAHPVSCVDCHDPDTMQLRVTRPGFILGIRKLAESDAAVPHLASIESWRRGRRAEPYDPNQDSTRQEMRSFVCAQCHVEYYCATHMPLTFPWGKGLTAENTEAYWEEETFPDGSPFYDYIHALTGAPLFKAQHPEFEVWSQGVHARAGVSCSDCHMPYMRDGASKISDHRVRSPMFNVNRACQTCHAVPEDELVQRVKVIQDRHVELLQNAGNALEDMINEIVKAREAGADDEALAGALNLHRQAHWYLDFIVSENSLGFHAPQETARVLANATNLARQGQLEAVRVQQALRSE